MAKEPQIGGFYLPHKRVQWTGLKPDPKTGELVKEPSRTKQSHKAECDINNIIKAYSAPGMIEQLHLAAAKGVYMDLPAEFDYQDALNIVASANEAFAQLPSRIRERFGNDPQKLLAFMQDGENLGEAIKLGLVKAPPPPEPEKQPPATTGGEGGKPPSEGPKGP